MPFEPSFSIIGVPRNVEIMYTRRIAKTLNGMTLCLIWGRDCSYSAHLHNFAYVHVYISERITFFAGPMPEDSARPASTPSRRRHG